MGFSRIFTASLLMLLSTMALGRPLVPAYSTDELATGETLSLAGKWGFVWGEWIAPETLSNAASDFKVIQLPNYLHQIVPEAADDQGFVHGEASYFIRLVNLGQHFSRPAIDFGQVREAWRAYWITPNGEVINLGHSGQIGKSIEQETLRDPVYILDLPADQNDGTLLIHLSAHHFDRSGLFSHYKVDEQEHILRANLVNLASRAFLVAVGLTIVIQNLVFFVHRRREKTLLLLAMFALISAARASLASGYVDYFVSSPDWTILFLKLEYLMVIWPATAAVHYVGHLFPNRNSSLLIKIAYGVLLVAACYTFLMPITQITLRLTYYQVSLLLVTLMAVYLITHGIARNAKDSRYFMISFVPLIIAVFNDIISARSAGYNFYIAEYALFIFLFLQTQLQASRFVRALDTAEHLTNNLQREVDRKTQQLSVRNAELEEKAIHLEEKHQEVKLLSETDHLTGLYNRQTLESRSKLLFEMAATYEQPLSVVMIDLDHFKDINDQYGHLVGDECLVFVASFLRGFNLRKRDIIARYGGEEITIILTDTPLESAQKIVQTICNGLSELPVQGDHPDIYLTASFGIADIATTGARDIQTLIQFADEALYRAKENGRNRVEFYTPGSAPEHC